MGPAQPPVTLPVWGISLREPGGLASERYGGVTVLGADTTCPAPAGRALSIVR